MCVLSVGSQHSPLFKDTLPATRTIFIYFSLVFHLLLSPNIESSRIAYCMILLALAKWARSLPILFAFIQHWMFPIRRRSWISGISPNFLSRKYSVYYFPFSHRFQALPTFLDLLTNIVTTEHLSAYRY